METHLNRKNRHLIYLTGLLCLLTMGVTGCKVYRQFTTPSLKPVTVAKVDVTLVKQSDEAAKFDVTLTLENPNSTPLPMKYTDLSLDVAGYGNGHTEYMLHRTVPANGTQTVTVPMVIVTQQKVVAGTAYATKGTVTYVPPGEFRKLMTESNVPLPTAVFDSKGQF